MGPAPGSTAVTWKKSRRRVAAGENGIWGRWQQCAVGAGGNVELAALLKADPTRQHAFRDAILKIADTHASEAEILERESHWKLVLHSREHGLNKN